MNKNQVVTSLLLLLALLIYLARVWWLDEGRYSLYDDAYISFRYARNLARGEGLVFNPGERVEGYTNFLWTVILAGAIRLGGDPIVVAKALGIVSGALILMVTVLLTHSLAPGRGPWVAIPALLLSTTASMPRYAISGMETLLFSLLLSLALWLELGVRKPWGSWLAALSLALAALTRPEGVLFFAVLMVAWAIERTLRDDALMPVLQGLMPSLVIFSAVFLPYFIGRYAYYGYPLSNSFYAKVGGLSSAGLSRGLTYLRNELLILNLPLALWGAFAISSFRRRGVRTMLVALVIYLVYLVLVGGDDWEVFGPRFLLVTFPWLAALGLVGLADLTSARRSMMTISCVAALALVGGLSTFEATGYRGVMDTMNRGWWTAAGWLDEQAARNELVAVDAAGIIPYHTNLPTLDMLGLNNLHIAHLTVSRLGSGLAGHEKFDPRYVLERQPDYITSWLDSQGQPISAGLGQVTYHFMDQYELAAVFLMGLQSSDKPVWVNMSDTVYTETLNKSGYIYGIFRRRIVTGP